MTNSRDLLKQACSIAEQHLADADYARLKDMPDIKPSKDFERRMRKLVKRMSSGSYNEHDIYKLYNTGRKVSKPMKTLIVVAALLATMSITVYAVEPIREKFKNFIIETFSTHSIVGFKEDETTQGSLYSEYTYIPEGYKKVSHYKDSYRERIVYENNTKNQLYFETYKSQNSTALIDTENINLEEVHINNSSGFYYSNKDCSQIMWTLGEYTYSINSENADVSKEDLIRIAESRQNIYE